MISRERIAKLIEQESGCYVLNDYSIGYVHLKLKYEPELYVNGKDNYILYIYGNDKKDDRMEIFDEDLFETLEEAEWHKDFGCIERIDVRKLELPTYYEFVKELKIIKFTNGINTYCLKYAWGTQDFIKLYIDNGEYMEILEEWEVTEENYILACRKCKELFLNEGK